MTLTDNTESEQPFNPFDHPFMTFSFSEPNGDMPNELRELLEGLAEKAPSDVADFDYKAARTILQALKRSGYDGQVRFVGLDDNGEPIAIDGNALPEHISDAFKDAFPNDQPPPINQNSHRYTPTWATNETITRNDTPADVMDIDLNQNSKGEWTRTISIKVHSHPADDPGFHAGYERANRMLALAQEMSGIAVVDAQLSDKLNRITVQQIDPIEELAPEDIAEVVNVVRQGFYNKTLPTPLPSEAAPQETPDYPE